MRALTMFAVLAGALAFAASAAQAALITVSPIDFNDDSDYNNGSPATTGLFRDLGTTGSYINRGTDGIYTALKFTTSLGFGVSTATVYDTTPSSNAVQNPFYGGVSLQTDWIYHHNTNSAAFGLVALQAESGSGIAVIASQGGTSSLRIYKTDSNGIYTGANLASVAMGNRYETWSYMTMDVTFPTSTTVTVVGKVYNLSPANPTGAIGTLVSTVTLSNYTLSNLNNVAYGEVGVTRYASNPDNNLSVTDLAIQGNDGTPVAVAGGPYTVLFNGNTNLAGSTGTGSYGTVTTWAWNLDNVDQGSDGNLYDDATGQTPNLTYAHLVNDLGLPVNVSLPIGLKVTNDVSLTSTAAGSLTIMPEPATLVLMGAGLAGLLLRRRHRG